MLTTQWTTGPRVPSLPFRLVLSSLAVLVGLTAGAPQRVAAQAPSPPASAGPMAATQSDTAHFYVCRAPTTCSCLVYASADEAKCPACTDWMTVSTTAPVVAAIQKLDTAGRYANAAGLFVSDAAAAMSGGQPTFHASAAALYGDPSAYGFREVPADSAPPGALVAFPNFAGLLLNADSQVLYPSAARQGRLAVSYVRFLSTGQTKYLVPAGTTGSHGD